MKKVSRRITIDARGRKKSETESNKINEDHNNNNGLHSDLWRVPKKCACRKIKNKREKKKIMARNRCSVLDNNENEDEENGIK